MTMDPSYVNMPVTTDAFVLVELASMAAPLVAQEEPRLAAYFRLQQHGLTRQERDPVSGRMGWTVTAPGRSAARAFQAVLGICSGAPEQAPTADQATVPADLRRALIGWWRARHHGSGQEEDEADELLNSALHDHVAALRALEYGCP